MEDKLSNSCVTYNRIICSWCLNIVNIGCHVFHYIQCFDQNFEKAYRPYNPKISFKGIEDGGGVGHAGVEDA